MDDAGMQLLSVLVNDCTLRREFAQFPSDSSGLSKCQPGCALQKTFIAEILEIPRKPADQRYCPARFPRAKMQEATRKSNPVRLGGRVSSLTTTPPRPLSENGYAHIKRTLPRLIQKRAKQTRRYYRLLCCINTQPAAYIGKSPPSVADFRVRSDKLRSRKNACSGREEGSGQTTPGGDLAIGQARYQLAPGTLLLVNRESCNYIDELAACLRLRCGVLPSGVPQAKDEYRRTGFDPRRGRSQIFTSEDRCRTVLLVDGFSRESPVSPILAFQRYSIVINLLRIEIRLTVRMDKRRNASMEETGDPRENPPASGIARHDPHMTKQVPISRTPATRARKIALTGQQRHSAVLQSTPGNYLQADVAQLTGNISQHAQKPIRHEAHSAEPRVANRQKGARTSNEPAPQFRLRVVIYSVLYWRSRSVLRTRAEDDSRSGSHLIYDNMTEAKLPSDERGTAGSEETTRDLVVAQRRRKRRATDHAQLASRMKGWEGIGKRRGGVAGTTHR
ncbi:hypothetical protein PR048_000904 [Dryococelus australis]|uniref:Uncharacterized protein n=1 Tax=Dryococelus australis TaxID=614101 RepID=A0ABQ9IIA5_9NEOP|nr:hypothetical protein PR048_000904 [Dryococelus australis]